MPQNFCPIALLSKVMKKVVKSVIIKYVDANELIRDRQHCFRRCRSTRDLLSYTIRPWTSAIEQHRESIGNGLDILKAFDPVVWHRALLSKIFSYRPPQQLRGWIRNCRLVRQYVQFMSE